MSMQCMPMGQKNIICRKIFLPYDITPVSMNKSSFYTSLLWKKNKKNVYRILQPIKFFCPIRNSMGILEMYLEIFLAQLFFWSSTHRSITLCKVHTIWEGHKILRNLPLTFDYSTYSQKLEEDFAKFCGLLRIYEL